MATIQLSDGDGNAFDKGYYVLPSLVEAAVQWKNHEDGVLLLESLEYLDVVTLIQKVKPVCKQWKQLCTKVIDNKCTGKKKKFQSKNELLDAVNKYSPGSGGLNKHCIPKVAEEIASTYGYPIDKWNVSNITKFYGIFWNKIQFNEPIGSWDVSNATGTSFMFWNANSFNQDLSSWNVSNVTNMVGMFNLASSFNQNLSSWDVSNVANMEGMFLEATSFNQDISAWDVSNVTTMRDMFWNATSFNQDISAWDVSNVTTMRDMFWNATSFNQNLSFWDVSNDMSFDGMFYNCPIDDTILPWFHPDMLLSYQGCW